jgi:orotidine-5'-phosphate decarboxylase
MHWGDIVSERVAAFGPLVLGIDPALNHAPFSMGTDAGTFLHQYTSSLLDGADGKIGFVKFQSAYFEAFGSAGVSALARSIAMARERRFAVILDAKRGDIGSTAEAYAQAYLTPKSGDLEVDSLTVNPFLGPDTLVPFVDRARSYGKGLFVLVKTSNEGSGWLQDQRVDGIKVSHRIAALLADWANRSIGESKISAVGAVVGATYPSEAAELRSLMPRSVFLAPGLGAQGGNPAAMAAIATATGPVLVSASRGIAAVEDRTLSLTDYVTVVRSRIDAFKSAITPSVASPPALPD